MPTTGSNAPAPPAYFPGLSQESSSSLTTWMTATMNARDAMLQQRMDAQEARQQQQTTQQFATMIAHLERLFGGSSTNQPKIARFLAFRVLLRSLRKMLLHSLHRSFSPHRQAQMHFICVQRK